MPAPTGNEFWKARSTHGRKPIFEVPELLEAACEEYFEWVEANPLSEERLVSYQGETKRENLSKMRAMTIEGLCIFLDIARSTWQEYGKRKDFLAVVTRVDEIIRTQKFQGAAADLLNPNIIARDLGLADKQAVDVKSGGKPIQRMSDDELQDIVSRAVARGNGSPARTAAKEGGSQEPG